MNEPQVATIVIQWADVAKYTLAFAGGLLVIVAGIGSGLAKWIVTKVLSAIDKTNDRIDHLEKRVDRRFLGLDRRMTRVETKCGLPTPNAEHDDSL